MTAVAADQRNLTVTMSIAGITAKVENDRRESVMKLAQAHDVSPKTVHAILHKELPLSVSGTAERSNCFTRRQRGAIQNVTSDHSGDRRSLANFLTVGRSARDEKRADQPQPQSRGLPEGAGGGAKNGTVASIAEALWQ
jgi:hypothetical protein